MTDQFADAERNGFDPYAYAAAKRELRPVKSFWPDWEEPADCPRDLYQLWFDAYSGIRDAAQEQVRRGNDTARAALVQFLAASRPVAAMLRQAVEDHVAEVCHCHLEGDSQ
jgi:hypothetical protein